MKRLILIILCCVPMVLSHAQDIDTLNRPLVVIDGVLQEDIRSEWPNPDSIAALMSLQPEEAVKQYGERGKNGALIITTNDYVAPTGDSTAVTEQESLSNESNTLDEKQAIRLKWTLASLLALSFMFIPVVIALIILLYDKVRGRNVSPAPLHMRFVDFCLDSLFLLLLQVVVVLCVVNGTVFSNLTITEYSRLVWRLVVSLLQTGAYFLYFFICEYYWGKTLGKKICGLKVVNEDGTRPSAKAIVKRTLSKYIPFEFISFFFTDKDENGNMTRMWHDTIPHTRVVRANAPTTNTEETV